MRQPLDKAAASRNIPPETCTYYPADRTKIGAGEGPAEQDEREDDPPLALPTSDAPGG